MAEPTERLSDDVVLIDDGEAAAEATGGGTAAFALRLGFRSAVLGIKQRRRLRAGLVEHGKDGSATPAAAIGEASGSIRPAPTAATASGSTAAETTVHVVHVAASSDAHLRRLECKHHERAAKAARKLSPVAAAGDGRRARKRVAQVSRARHGQRARAEPLHRHNGEG